jgi:hypothetical protein
VSYDQSNGLWVVVKQATTLKEYITDMYLTEGRTYSFRVEARNELGYSFPSESISILAAQVPGTPQAPTTFNTGKSIRITWTPPDDGGTPILSYRLFIRNVDSTEFFEDLTYCDGSDPTVFAERTCTVPNTVLNAAPYNILWGDGVYAKFEATNVYGTSPISVSGNGAILINGPT